MQKHRKANKLWQKPLLPACHSVSLDGAIVYACDRAEGVMDEWAKTCSEDNDTRVLPLYFDGEPSTAVTDAMFTIEPL